MHYLIDGYNLLHAMGAIPRRAGPHGLEKARLRLLGLLRGTYGDRAGEVMVVFDAAHAQPGAAGEEDYHGVRVCFAVGHEQADELIEDLIRHNSAPKRLTVISDDRRIQQAARRRRCPVVSCLDYLDDLRRRRGHRPVDAEKKVTSSSDDEVRNWLAIFAGGEGEAAATEFDHPDDLDDLPEAGTG